jgi:hypothetical protein
MTHFKINLITLEYTSAAVVQTSVNFAYNVCFIKLHTARMKQAYSQQSLGRSANVCLPQQLTYILSEPAITSVSILNG